MDHGLATVAPRAISAEPWPGRPSDCLPQGDDAPMTIAEVARDFAVTTRALRFYESKRLIAPLRAGPVRLYRREDRERLGLILMGRRLGFTLAEVGEMIAARSGDGDALALTREKCVEQIRLLERQKRALELAIAELRQIYTAFYRQRIAAADAPPRAISPTRP